MKYPTTILVLLATLANVCYSKINYTLVHQFNRDDTPRISADVSNQNKIVIQDRESRKLDKSGLIHSM